MSEAENVLLNGKETPTRKSAGMSPAERALLGVSAERRAPESPRQGGSTAQTESAPVQNEEVSAPWAGALAVVVFVVLLGIAVYLARVAKGHEFAGYVVGALAFIVAGRLWRRG